MSPPIELFTKYCSRIEEKIDGAELQQTIEPFSPKEFSCPKLDNRVSKDV
jgi:hypothetical protein